MEEKENWTSIDLYYRGFHINKSISANVSPGTLKTMIDDYISQGYEPSWNAQTTKEHMQPAAPVTNVPVCQVHGTPMTERTGQYGKFWSCSSKLLDGSYCKWRPTK